MKKILFFICSILISQNLSAAIRISEVMPCNYSTYLDPTNYNYSGYVEIENDGDENIDISSYTISNYKKKTDGYKLQWKWTVGEETIVPAHSYLTIWCDETNASNHSPYKLETSKGSIAIYSKSGLVDSLSYEDMVPHLSYGRYGTEVGYMEPSLNEKNNNCYEKLSKSRCSAPKFNEAAGIKEQPFILEITSSTVGADIYYTTNGTEPSLENGIIYTGPIEINQNANIRARAYTYGMLPSEITTGSYIYADEARNNCGGFELPIVSLTVDSFNYYSDMAGICVVGKNGIGGEKDCTSSKANYNRDWKRPVNFEYIVNGKQIVSQEVESAVEGGCSRSESIKSLSIKASKKSGKNKFDYKFFQSKPDITHQTLHIRNGGTAYSSVRFRDGLMQTFASTMNIDFQAFQPICYYINGKYIGYMNLNERTNSDYIKSNYGIDEEDIDLITISDQLGIRASKGDTKYYDEMVNYITKTDVNDPNYFKNVSKMMDIDEYIDYQIFQQFIVNTDWPGNNTKIWKERKDDSRFRWILFDTDFGLGLPGFSYLGTYASNMIYWCAGEGKTYWANNRKWMTEIFAHLKDNEEFKKKFLTKYLIYMQSTFSDNNIEAVFDSVTSLMNKEYCVYKNTSAETEASKMKTFALKRASYIYGQLKVYAGGQTTLPLTIASNVEGAILTMNGERTANYNGKYFTNVDLELKAYPPAGYKFDHWETSAEMNLTEQSKMMPCNMPGTLKGSILAATDIKAIFTKTDIESPTVVINEICASSDSLSNNKDDYNKYPDWIEIYNNGENDVDIAGLFLTLGNKSSQIPYGYDETVIKSKGRKLLWAKGDKLDGPLYLDFKLDVESKNEICLKQIINSSKETIDCALYQPHAKNESFGWEKDNSGNWVLFNKCGATPGIENGSNECTEESNDIIIAQETNGFVMYPNPATNIVTIEAENLNRIIITDINGRLIKDVTATGEKQEINISDLDPAIYIVRIMTTNTVKTAKLIKE